MGVVIVDSKGNQPLDAVALEGIAFLRALDERADLIHGLVGQAPFVARIQRQRKGRAMPAAVFQKWVPAGLAPFAGRPRVGIAQTGVAPGRDRLQRLDAVAVLGISHPSVPAVHQILPRQSPARVGVINAKGAVEALHRHRAAEAAGIRRLAHENARRVRALCQRQRPFFRFGPCVDHGAPGNDVFLLDIAVPAQVDGADHARGPADGEFLARNGKAAYALGRKDRFFSRLAAWIATPPGRSPAASAAVFRQTASPDTYPTAGNRACTPRPK